MVDTTTLKDSFPFASFLVDYLQLTSEEVDVTPSDIIFGKSLTDSVLQKATELWQIIETTFVTLEGILPFENLRDDKERRIFLLATGSKVIGMTPKLAQRKIHFNDKGFAFDTLIVDSALINDMDIIQVMATNAGILGRIVFINDVKQSWKVEGGLYENIASTGITLDLVNSCAKKDLIETGVKVRGLPANKTQFVDVSDYKGKGMEIVSQDKTHNLPEAESIVALYMYLRLKMHDVVGNKLHVNAPTQSIVILTTEQAQKALITNLLRQKCAWHPLLGIPDQTVKTLDEYLTRGVYEDDIVLCSLVWTGLSAPALLNRAFTLDQKLLEWLSSRAKLRTVIFFRHTLFQHVITNDEVVHFNLTTDEAEVKDFRQMYKVVQGILTHLEEMAANK